MDPLYDTSCVNVPRAAGDLGHFALGFLAGLGSNKIAAAAALAFGGYELAKLSVGDSGVMGKVWEFGLGMLLGRIAINGGLD